MGDDRDQAPKLHSPQCGWTADASPHGGDVHAADSIDLGDEGEIPVWLCEAHTDKYEEREKLKRDVIAALRSDLERSQAKHESRMRAERPPSTSLRELVSSLSTALTTDDVRRIVGWLWSAEADGQAPGPGDEAVMRKLAMLLPMGDPDRARLEAWIAET